MKKVVVVSLAGLLVIAVGGVIAFHTITAKGFSTASSEVSPKAAKVLQQKIDTIKSDAENSHRAPGASRVELSESELESYLLYSLKEEIPAQVDTARVQLNRDLVSLDTQITFPSNATGNPVVDTLMGGTHDLSLTGQFVARESRGKFDLKEVRVDGIPVPNVLIQALIKKYVNPKYPEVNLNEPFDMPWGIEELTIGPGKANVVY